MLIGLWTSVGLPYAWYNKRLYSGRNLKEITMLTGQLALPVAAVFSGAALYLDNYAAHKHPKVIA